MTRSETATFFYLVSILVSISITVGVMVYTLRRRRVIGAGSFALALSLEAAWTIGYLMETISLDLEGKIFWDNLQWVPTFFLPLALLSFSRSYANKKFQHGSTWLLLSILPVISSVLLFTNPLHGLMMSGAAMVPGEPFPLYTYQFGPLCWLSIGYSYIYVMMGVTILIRHAMQHTGSYRRQIWVVITGFSIPTLGTVLTLAASPFFVNRDISPYSFAIANLFIAVGIFHLRLFEILPFARDMVMVNMQDGVIILDVIGRALDINTAARSMLGIPEQKIIGRHISDLLPGAVESLQLNQAVPSQRLEIAMESGGETSIVEFQITRLVNNRGDFSGHMMILRDITLRKQREAALRRDQDVLEERVRERTNELQTANEQLKIEVEQRRRAELEKESQSKEMEILYRLAIELAAMPADSDMESIVTTRLKELTGAYLVTVSEYNPASRQLELRQLEADPQVLRKIRHLVGKDLPNLAFPVSPKMYSDMTTRLVSYETSLNAATLGAIPEAAGRVLQRMFKLDLFIGMAAQYQGELLGSVMLVLQTGQPAPSDQLIHALANIISIVYQRKRAEQARRESETRFHTLAEMLPQAIFECDLAGQITYANRMAFDIFGYALDDPKITVMNTLIESERSRAVMDMGKIIEKQQGHHNEYQVQRKDGSIFPALVYVAPIIKTGHVVGLRGVVIDISERKIVEDALRSSEEKFRSIIEQMSEGIMLVGEDGHILELNQAFEQIYGMKRNELLGKPFWEMTRRLNYTGSRQPLNPEAAAQQDFQAILKNTFADQPKSDETEFISPDNKRHIIQRTAFPVNVSQGRRLAAIVRDITDQKNAELEQRRLNRTLTMISECNQALIRLDDEADLIRRICNILVEIGDYRLASITITHDSPDKTHHVITSHGDDGGYLALLSAREDDLESQSIRAWWQKTGSAAPLIIRDVREQLDLSPSLEEAGRCGLLSLMIFPLFVGQEFFGSLNIYAAHPHSPDENESGLLTEMVNDVSFGIYARRTLIARGQAEERMHAAINELHHAYEATLEGWSRALELRERETAGHSQRVVELTLKMAANMGLPPESMVHIRRGALLHDIGKMGIPDRILLKPGPLSAEEWIIMRQHPEFAHQLLARIPYLVPGLEIPYCHHERWDGSGYPRQLQGSQIPLTARIFAVVDVWDALTSDRPYRAAWTEEAVCAYLREQSGIQFDPDVVQTFLNLRAWDDLSFEI